MLTALTIQNIVLIERLTVSFSTGLTALTGETGAGKSILLDALGLALGGRADSGLVRQGAERASVTAEFDIHNTHRVHDVLADQGLRTDDGDRLVLRRTVGQDGRSRAHINDQPVSIGMLRTVGDLLVEVHGQFETHGLLDARTHIDVLDAFAGLDAALQTTAGAWTAWRSAAKARADAERQAEEARREEEYLRLTLEEFDALTPEEGEEDRLVEQRTFLMNREKIATAINAALEGISGHKGAVSGVVTAQKALDRVGGQAGNRFDAVIEGIDRALAELEEVRTELESVGADMDLDSRELERIDDRLHALRDLGRKHRVPVTELAALHKAVADRLALIDSQDDRLGGLAATEAETRKTYEDAAAVVAEYRRQAAERLDRAMAAELPPLKLDKARFETAVEAVSEREWGPSGTDRVTFLVATNPGTTPGPINRIASGGELARFMLALKVVLAEGQRQAGAAPTLVFDEVDTGIGGAVADAVGERLGRLATGSQILVVTHSPQVAARAESHAKVEKTAPTTGGVAEDSQESLATVVRPLDLVERREEIARMLSGAAVTDAARAAADSLMAHHPAPPGKRKGGRGTTGKSA